MSENSNLVSSTNRFAQQNGTSASHNYGATDEITTDTTPTSTIAAIAAIEGPGGGPDGPAPAIDDHSHQLHQMDKRSTLRIVEKIGFGLGHVYNDLCAGVWFSYTLLFMQGALGMPAPEAGALVMLGQVGDAIATPIVGWLTDKYGTKRQWHIAGTFLVFLTFPMIFSLCPWCDVAPHWWEIVYFTIVILLFQFGWPIVQITHLAMIPELSRSQKDRSDLTAIRYSVSIVSNVVVYIVTWAVLRSRMSADAQIGAGDAYRFRDISLILTLVGVSMSVLFNFSLTFSGYEHRRHAALQHNVIKKNNKKTEQRDPEKQSLLRAERNGSITSNSSLVVDGTTSVVDIATPGSSNGGALSNGGVTGGGAGHDEVVLRKPKKNFFKSPLLYQNALLYVFSRLFMTTSLVYMPLWLDERSLNPDSVQNNASVEHLATVPLVSFLASFIASLALKYTNKYVSNSFIYLIGSAISLGACTWIALSTRESTPFSTFELLVIASLFGAGSSITMISSLCITADMIGKHADQGGFIYSAVTFFDKFITGVVVVIIESMKCHDRTDCPDYYRSVLAYACGAAAGLGCVTLATLACTTPRARTRRLQQQR